MPPIGISLFRGLQKMQGPAALKRRLKRGIEDGTEHPERAAERLGQASEQRPGGPLVWVHLQDTDEIEKTEALLRHFMVEREDLNTLFTTTLYTGDDIHIKDGVHQFAPYSAASAVTAFLDHWKPNVILWMDSQLDAILLSETFDRGIPCFWVNASLPKETQRQWRWVPGSAKAILGGFETIFAQNKAAGMELRRHGAPSRIVRSVGPLQMQVEPPGCDMAERDRIAPFLSARPVWLASGATAAEIEAVVSAHRQLLRRSHRLLLIVEPNDKATAQNLAHRLDEEGMISARRSLGQDPLADVQVFIADNPEETGLWMHLAPITFIGGSLSGSTPVNPLEPASLGSVVLFGSNMIAHHDAAHLLLSSGAARKVRDAGALKAEVEHLLSPDRAAQLAMAAWDVMTSGAEVSDLIRDKVLGALDRMGV